MTMFRRLAAAALCLAFSVPAYAVASQPKCKGEGKLRSKNSKVATEVIFANRTARNVEVYWLDFKGRRVFYMKLTPGASYTQQTYVTHPWIVVSSDGKCYGPYKPKAEAVTFDVE
jgi:von Hippel-Lindau disease tumor supressor